MVHPQAVMHAGRRLAASPAAALQPPQRPLTAHQAEVRDLFDRLADEREAWLKKNKFFYDQDHTYMRHLVPAGLSVLEIGCGNGQLLAALLPSRGVGIDLSPRMIAAAQAKYPQLEFYVGNAEDPTTLAGIEGVFDVVILSDTVGLVEDCEALFRALHVFCKASTRLVIAYYSHYWEPLLSCAEAIGQKMPQVQQNWLSTDDTINLLEIADFQVVKRDWRQLVPKRLMGVGRLVNRFIAPLPLVRKLCLRNYVVARPLVQPKSLLTVSVIVPCRNERGNIENVVLRLPRFAPKIEVIFVEGHSSDGTFEECLRVQAAYPEIDIKVLRQDGKGKADAVRKGFDAANGDVLMILDADLTVPPEWLVKFYQVLAEQKGEFVNGTRLVYPMGSGAMRFLNLVANRLFARVFSYLLNQRFTDTLCGTKVLFREGYRRIAENRAYFGDFDPFGDFDLIFGAAKLNQKIVEVPVRYTDRVYGETQISRFSHGWLLIRMVIFAWRKLKAI